VTGLVAGGKVGILVADGGTGVLVEGTVGVLLGIDVEVFGQYPGLYGGQFGCVGEGVLIAVGISGVKSGVMLAGSCLSLQMFWPHFARFLSIYNEAENNAAQVPKFFQLSKQGIPLGLLDNDGI